MNRYVSIFKIDGKPILPPLMTESREMEMREYRNIACRLEQKYQIKRNFCNALQRTIPSYPQSSDDSSSVDYPTTYRKTESSFPDHMHNDSILDSSLTSTIEECIEQTTSANIKSVLSTTSSRCEIVPDLCENGTTDDNYKLLEHFRNEMSKSVPLPVTKDPDSPPHTLIRSNSYTLLTPSPMLLKQIELEGAANEECKKLEPKKLYTEKAFSFKTSTKKLKPRIMQKKPISSMHHKKSPYDSSITSKNRNPVTKTSVVKLTTKHSAKNNFVKENIRCISTEPNETKSTKNDIKVLSHLKDEQKRQLMDLLARQKIEEKKLEEQFHKKHDLILKQLHESIITTNNVAKLNEAVIEPVSQVLLQQYLDMAKSTPPVKFNDNIQPSKSVQNATFDAGITGIKHRSTTPQKPNRSTRLDNDKRNSAATIINAYVRGYLVRRLFETYHVQKIVQVIRDTLIFVLDLHEESQNNNDPADIVLKSQLLQQLSSACYSLHELFFGITQKERLDLISRDRDLMKVRIKRLKKLSNLKLSKNNKVELYNKENYKEKLYSN